MKLTREDVLSGLKAIGFIIAPEDESSWSRSVTVNIDTLRRLIDHFDKPLAESAVAPGECGSVPDERAVFEAHVRSTTPKYASNTWYLERSKAVPDMYYNQRCDDMWKGWQARAALGMQPPNTAGQSNEQNAVQTEQPSLSDARIEIAINVVQDAILEYGNGIRRGDTSHERSLYFKAAMKSVRALLAQRQDTPPLSIPTETGIYAWLNEYSAALVMVNKRPSDCSPGGVLNGHVMESTKFYDGCRVEYWTGGKWFGPLRAAIANGAPK